MRELKWIAIGLGTLLLFGVLAVTFTVRGISSQTDHCRDALDAANEVIQIDAEIMNISAAALPAARNQDTAQLQALGQKMVEAENRLNEVRPRYIESSRKCEGQ